MARPLRHAFLMFIDLRNCQVGQQGVVPFASGFHRLRPLGSINAPSLRPLALFSVRRGLPMRRDQVDLGDLMACRIESDEQPLPRRHRDSALLRAGTRCGQLCEEEAAAERDRGGRGV
jgi:hypothetical protein